MITMDFAIFAIAFNLGKLLAKGKKYAPKQAKIVSFIRNFGFCRSWLRKIRIHSSTGIFFYSENLKLAA
jgi:hypothetical protein